MADVKLILTADNSQYVSKVKEAQKATQNLHNTVETSSKKRLGYIEAEEKRITHLTELRRKSYDTKTIEFYNKTIDDSKKRLEEYGKVGLEANKKIEESGNKLKAVWAGIAAGVAGVAASFRILKQAVLETETGFNNFNIVTAVTKQLLYDIIKRTPWKEWKDNMKEVASIQDKLNTLRKIERQSLKDAAEYQIIYQRNFVEAHDKTKSATDQIKSYDRALLALNYSIKIESENTATRLALVKEWLKTAPDNERLLEEESTLTLKLLSIKEREYSATKEIASMRTGIIKTMNEEQRKSYEESQKAIYKETEEYYLGMRDLFFDYIDDINEAKEEKWKFDSTIADLLFKANKKRAKELWEMMLEDEKKITDLEKYSIEQRKENLRSFTDTAQSFISTLGEISNAQTEKLRFDREVLDTRISETQSALETEVELYKAGYASNVAAKQKELDELKKQRDIALRDEEEARKKSHRIAMAALLAEKAASVAQIIINTKIANAKALAASPLTFGLPWVAYNNVTAALSIAALTAAFALAATAKYAKGGWTGSGGQRDETGERMAGIVHEEEFVVRKGPAHRFRDVLEAINKEDRSGIFNSFNKLNPEIVGTSINNVMVENSGPNKRLDRIHTQLSQLNTKLTPRKQINEDILNMNNMTIYKRGNVTRIIKR